MKGPVLHTRDQPRGGRDFPLQVADAASAWSRDADAQLEASDAGAESEDVVGTCSHTTRPRSARRGPELPQLEPCQKVHIDWR